MNNAQRIVGCIGALLVILVAFCPLVDVSGQALYHYTLKYEDSEKELYNTNVREFSFQQRMFLFEERSVPDVPYKPEDTRVFDERKGYLHRVCSNIEVTQYAYNVNIKQSMHDLIIILIPSLLLLFVFYKPGKD